MKIDPTDAVLPVRAAAPARRPEPISEDPNVEAARFAPFIQALMREKNPPANAVTPPEKATTAKEPPGASPFVMGTRDLVRLIEDALDRSMPRCNTCDTRRLRGSR